jgi:hypothetical protein
MSCNDPNYERPGFPALYWPHLATDPEAGIFLCSLYDIWRFTLLWTLIVYGIFHMAAALLAIFMQLGRGKVSWKYIWIIPLAYALLAAIEAVLAGGLVGLVFVSSWIMAIIADVQLVLELSIPLASSTCLPGSHLSGP